ncbi:MAG: hypothetical protein WD844_15750 [Thermoleophilaceae bacterium]
MSTTTYRGRSLEEILPRIKTELGPDAIVVRQRSGLTGGIGGFFQRQCVEVEAKGGNGRIDVYDEPPEPQLTGQLEPEPQVELRNDAATRDGLASPAVKKLIEQAQPFAETLRHAVSAPLVAGRRPPAEAGVVEDELVAAGLRADIAASAVSETVSHMLPFASPGALRDLVRDAVARRIRVAPSWAGAGRSLALVGSGGSGKTSCVARLVQAYAVGSDLPVVCLSLRPADGGSALRSQLADWGVEVEVMASAEAARARVEAVRGHAAVVIDTPAVSVNEPEEVAALGRELALIGLYEVHLALPATLSGPAAREQARAFGELGASRIVLTHADETEHLGPVLGLAIGEGLPVSYVAPAPGRLAPADARSLAQRLLP